MFRVSEAKIIDSGIKGAEEANVGVNMIIAGQEGILDDTSGDRSRVDSSRFQGAQVRGKASLEKFGH